ncbi:hypothetical protein Pcinc_014360 [Petrolisthes cinctipes]|uniref:Uncharacterized protein n=1 Tax=Petrolisthes cinctipes TaxID=88211 RepID=A0AAE1FX56_PETCI|nr:hypothetical protein Pcinc_014360 [Petrolisthes cinctipes]
MVNFPPSCLASPPPASCFPSSFISDIKPWELRLMGRVSLVCRTLTRQKGRQAPSSAVLPHHPLSYTSSRPSPCLCRANKINLHSRASGDRFTYSAR